MRLRMERRLPADLARRVLSGELRSNAQIKQQIKDWQADWLRA